MKKKNVVYIITDQQRFDYIGAAKFKGYPLETPNLDRIAASGMQMERFYCNNPICTPSRATIITGRYPRSTRVYDNGCPLPESEVTLPGVLAENGYDTRAIGKVHLTPWNDKSATYFESFSYWEQKEDDSPEAYMGFKHAEICMGHVRNNTGHYGCWLKKKFPYVFENWKTFLKPHPSGVSQTSIWNMPLEAHVNYWIADRTIDYLHEKASDDEPFFLHVGFPDPHHPYRVPEPYGTMYSPDDIELPCLTAEGIASKPPEYLDFMKGIMNKESLGCGDFNTDDFTNYSDEDFKTVAAISMGMVSFIDDQVGRILNALEETGLDENTIVVFTSDHGDLMGDQRILRKGPFMLEGLIRVPMLICGPGIMPETKSAALASHVDFMPTLLELLDIENPIGLEGISFAKVLLGMSETCRSRVLVEFLHQFMFDRNVKSIVTENAKLTWWGGQDYGELYYLENDPNEVTNLFNDPNASELKTKLMCEMLDEIIVSENILPLPPAVA